MSAKVVKHGNVEKALDPAMGADDEQKPLPPLDCADEARRSMFMRFVCVAVCVFMYCNKPNVFRCAG